MSDNQGADVLAHLRLEPARAYTLDGDDEDAFPRPYWNLRTTVAPRTRHRILVAPAMRDTAGRPITGARVAVLGGPGPAERALAAPLLAALPESIDLVGHLTLPEADRRAVLARIRDVLPDEVEVVSDIDLHLARRAPHA